MPRLRWWFAVTEETRLGAPVLRSFPTKLQDRPTPILEAISLTTAEHVITYFSGVRMVTLQSVEY